MKKRRCWRYTCEFCKKTGGQAGAILAHEARCFANPNRHCTMCEAQWPRPELLAIMAEINYDKPQEIVPQLEKEAEYCPACVVSAWRQFNPTQEVDAGWDCIREEYTECAEVKIYLEYDYKAKSAEYCAEKRREEVSQYSGLGDDVAF